VWLVQPPGMEGHCCSFADGLSMGWFPVMTWLDKNHADD
jgi:hypothetical protein